LPDVRSTEARSAGIECPAGVARSFQVSLYKVEPAKSVLARNLFAKDVCRAALRDEPVEVRPQVPLVSHPAAFACRAERLAGAASRPHLSVIRDASATQGVTPNSDASEEMALSKSSKVIGRDIFD